MQQQQKPKFETAIPENLSMQEVFMVSDIVSEKGVLACIMKDAKLISDAERRVAATVFSYTGHRWIYQLMTWMYKEAIRNNWGLSFDRVTMLSAVKYLPQEAQQCFMPGAEGNEQLKTLDLMLPMVDTRSYQQYVAQLLDANQRREGYMLLRQEQLKLLNRHENPSARSVFLKASAGLSRIAVSTSDNDEAVLRQFGDFADPLLQKARLARKYKGLFNVPCELYPYLMKLFGGGFVRKGLILCCARPKVGKSSWTLATAINMALGDPDPVTLEPRAEKIPACYLDTEMTGEEQMSRGLSNVANLNEFSLLTGQFFGFDGDVERVKLAREKLMQAPFYYARVAGKPVHYIQSLMRQFRNEHVGTRDLFDDETGQTFTYSKPGVVFYDWLKLPESDGKGSDKEYIELGNFASKLKDTGAELDLPVVAGGQANRGAVGVTAADWEQNAEAFVAGSDRLAQFCTCLMIMRNVLAQEVETIKTLGLRPGKSLEEHGHGALQYNQVLHIVLQRRGPDFRRGIPLYLERGRTRYEEMATPEILQFMAENAGKKLVALNADHNKGKVPKAQSVVAGVGVGSSGGGTGASPIPVSASSLAV